MHRRSMKTRFYFGAGCILFVFCGVFSLVQYFALRNIVIDDVYKNTEIFIGTASATRNYVKDVLRPHMVELLSPEAFVPEAMSTSFVSREVLNGLRDRFPDFSYKRAAHNPKNPVNMADSFEMEKLRWFGNHPETDEWHGIIEKDNRSFFTRMKAIYAEAQCLKCHGRPGEAPDALKEIYGSENGYDFNVGDVVAADTIYIPVDVSFFKIKETAWLMFVVAATALFSLLGLFILLFNRTVVTDLKGVLTRFKTLSGHELAEPRLEYNGQSDELEQVKWAFEDVASDLKVTHDTLRASEAKFRLLFESSQDAILILDGHTRMRDINPAGLQFFGFCDKEEALSIETCFQLFWDTRDAAGFWEEINEKGFARGLELPLVDRNGKKLTAIVSASRRVDENGRPAGIYMMLTDTTEKRRMEKYLAQTEKLASIGQLASGVAHEINNPLGVIRCYANLIAKSRAEDAQVVEDLQIIRKHTDQCKSVVEALLNFARVSEPRKAAADVRACLEEVLSVLEVQFQKSRIEIRRCFADDLPHVTLDAAKIKQVFMNLLINARQAMENKGSLTVSVQSEPDKNMLSIAISDTGAGISDLHIDRIFDPFFTTKGPGKGTGLGLSVSYGIVKQHGGDIVVESAPGNGTTFTIFLPLDEDGRNCS
ncbi:PAS domain S-box-containing protein [Desulfosalsimonas propionicica]|uniref:histidine kinase n=1 Tax=Desulfosalsimonas propionicica TaxID=332175 RepID=A0A7W0HLW8_9BACT|nr:DUF3365 domain-containing protein [Desulfosalsimonas propionicica]MBA2882723.1 PAS domain S-box-containing protein [Desulfosalsimonas propionicica]